MVGKAPGPWYGATSSHLVLKLVRIAVSHYSELVLAGTFATMMAWEVFELTVLETAHGASLSLALLVHALEDGLARVFDVSGVGGDGDGGEQADDDHDDHELEEGEALVGGGKRRASVLVPTLLHPSEQKRSPGTPVRDEAAKVGAPRLLSAG